MKKTVIQGIRRQAISISTKRKDHRHMHRLMDTEQNINTVIIHLDRFIIDTGRRLYFYLKGNNWEVGASLPSSIRVELGDSVSIELDTDKPYIYHADHVKKYPPGQMKKKNKKKDKWG